MATMNLTLPRLQPKQMEFAQDRHKHVGFGGARGGGKSFALRVIATLMCLKYSGIVVMIIRRTFPELKANHIRPFKKMLRLGMKGNPIKYNDAEKVITFPNGSLILFRYCDNDNDADRFQGTEADVIMFDEATLLREEWIVKIRACLRGVNDFPHRFYYTMNPNGESMPYFKRLFIDRRFTDGENPDDYSFIQSLVTDNLALMKKDPTYVQVLESLPPKIRKAWLEGSWDTFEGLFFDEWREDPSPSILQEHNITYEDAKTHGLWCHVIKPFDIPQSWKIVRGYDWGFGRPFSVGWYAVPEVDDKREAVPIYRILELYGCTDTPNEGVRWTNRQQMDEIQRIEREHPWLKGRKIIGYADPSIWDGSHDTDGISCAEEAEKHGLWFEKGNNERIAGWMQVRERMMFDENGRALFYVFENCKQFIRCVPLMLHDKHKVEDLDTTLEDHCLDECRYVCMSRVIPPRRIVNEMRPIADPLGQFPSGQQGRYTKLHEIGRR